MAKSKLLIEYADQDYLVSEEDINTYAQQIGININTEKHLMWIAKNGLSENVPKPWLILADEKSRVFYYNPETHEKSWLHPIDKEYSILVSEERSKSKSFNSASSDYGFESKLSSLADAPPLSSSGKNSPLPLKRGKHEGGLPEKKLEFGRIENRRGTQLAPVRLKTLKMPTASFPKSSSGMSFMPKGSTLAKNVKQGKEDAEDENQFEEGLDYGSSHIEDSNESENSDEGSKYSYEETDEDDKHVRGLQPYDMLDTSHLSPLHSVDESPDALDINSLVQFGTKLPPRFEHNLKKDQSKSMHERENSPSLSLRKVGQPSFLKPITQITKKKSAIKGSKAAKKPKKYSNDDEMYLNDNITITNAEQQLMLEQIENDWIILQDELEKKEKEKYEEILRSNAQKLEEEEVKLRNENSDKISKIKYELQKRIEEEENVVEKCLQSLKIANKEKISEEEKKLQKELEIVSEALKDEIKKMEEKNASELAERKKALEETSAKELDSLRLHLDFKKKNVEEAHEAEISNLKQIHEQKVEELKSLHEKEVEQKSSAPQKSELQEELQKLEELIKNETENYQILLKKKEDMHKEITNENKYLEELKNETSEAQATVEKLQDEIEKTENDLDLLRSEKSGFISELNILKENINEKSNLEKKLKTTFEKTTSKELSEVGTNTDISFIENINMICKAVQVSILYSDAFSQVEADSVLMSDALCQTTLLQTTSKSSQTDKVPSTNNENVKAHVDSRTVSDKNLENVLSGLSSKLDSRINIIEHQIRSLQENLSRPAASEPIHSSQEYLQNQFTEVKTLPSSENRNIPSTYYTNNSETAALFSSSIPMSSQNKCKCELGDIASCDVLQDVKNSVYRLNDILYANFVPPVRSYNLYQVNQPLGSYSSPFDNFYAQFRQMQEKHRVTELKHKCENDVMKLTKESSTTLQDAKMSGNTHDKKLPYRLLHSDMYSYNISEDPLNRARTVILKEKAKAWKDQQINPPVSHIFSMNSLSECSQSSITGFVPPHNVPSSEQTFLNFEADPEPDYNMWMTRLNALQLRIRSHKML